ncbi:N-acetylmuramoyl-L-alanine amidase family protein [Paenibacillus agilis]|nr:N-acetylmuramoyl-L-alanine amidase [Paenibacillus agilis]
MSMKRSLFIGAMLLLVFTISSSSLQAQAAHLIQSDGSEQMENDEHHAHPENNLSQNPNTKHIFHPGAILIDAGHGGIDGGTVHGNVLEKDINLAIARKLYLLLRSKGVPAVLNRTGDYALSDDNRWSATRSRHRKDLAQRRQLAKELPVSMFVSLHVNWSKNSRTRGPIVLHSEEGRSALLAYLIQQNMNPSFNTRNDCQIGPTFYLLRKMQQPAVIVEMGFISNEADRTMLTHSSRQSAVAEQICNSIMHYFATFS